jgi:hypothetical protein
MGEPTFFVCEFRDEKGGKIRAFTKKEGRTEEEL